MISHLAYRKFVAIIACLAFSIDISANSIYVGKTDACQSIKDALTKCHAGDTLYINGGVYKEKNITVGQRLTIIGINFPVLDGEHKYQILSLKADSITINGLKLINSGVSSIEDIAAIKLYNCHGSVIYNNIFEGAFFGVYCQACVNCLIKQNRLTGFGKTEQESGNGIHCWKSDSLSIIGNVVSGHRDGIYFEFVTNSIISKNYSYSNMRYGLHFMFSHNDEYTDNTFRNNGAGVSVMFTHGVKMFNNTFDENWGDGCYGIFLKEIIDSYIEGNKFTRNTTGIYFEGTSRIVVDKNVFENNGWALKIEASCLDNTIAQNNFISNSFDVGTNGSLVLNKFDHNYWDKYEGYDLNKDNIGDVPYRPVSLFSMVVERNPSAMILFRSFMASLLDKSEKVLPTLIPEDLKDNFPYTKPIKL